MDLGGNVPNEQFFPLINTNTGVKKVVLSPLPINDSEESKTNDIAYQLKK